MSHHVHDLKLSVRGAEDLASIRRFGQSALREVKARLAELGLRLGH